MGSLRYVQCRRPWPRQASFANSMVVPHGTFGRHCRPPLGISTAARRRWPEQAAFAEARAGCATRSGAGTSVVRLQGRCCAIRSEHRSAAHHRARHFNGGGLQEDIWARATNRSDLDPESTHLSARPPTPRLPAKHWRHKQVLLTARRLPDTSADAQPTGEMT
jgi:hypothetical protein